MSPAPSASRTVRASRQIGRLLWRLRVAVLEYAGTISDLTEPAVFPSKSGTACATA
jgi:hypothetical protein